MNLAVETEQETDGRWIAEIPRISGALAYGADRREAISRVEALALRILAERLEHAEMSQELEEPAWKSEIRDRIRAIDEGRMTGVAYEDVMRAAENRLVP